MESLCVERHVNPFYMHDVVSIRDFSREDLEFLFHLAKRMESVARGTRSTLLADKLLACLFFQASTRTRLSFEAAMQRLGGGVIGFADPKMTRSGDYYQEDLEDTIRMVMGYSDAIVMRHFATGAPGEAALVSDVPIINGGDGYGEHPTQAMIDLYTIWKEKEDIDNLRIGMLGDLTQRSMKSFVYGIAKWEIELICVAPEEMRFSANTSQFLDDIGQQYRYSSDIRQVIDQLDVIYMMSVLQPSYSKAIEEADEKQDAAVIPSEYLVNQALLKGKRPDIMVMHPLPRKAELARDVDDMPQAHYFQQALNGIPVRMALLAGIFGRMP